jgi:hypothetical protein
MVTGSCNVEWLCILGFGGICVCLNQVLRPGFDTFSHQRMVY